LNLNFTNFEFGKILCFKNVLLKKKKVNLKLTGMNVKKEKGK
jgi:hypothetical protein